MRKSEAIRTMVVALILLCNHEPSASAQVQGVLGYWREPGGSVLHVEPCGPNVCASIVTISPAAPVRFDGKNPDHALRSRTLCGLRIGEGFHLGGANKAEGGHLYDPKSGRTYQGTMSSSGDELRLRGYIGIGLFGRTETWKRKGATAVCTS